MIFSVDDLIMAHEGRRHDAYLDTEGVWTCGIGCTGSDIGPGTVWDDGTIDARFDTARNQAVADAVKAVGPEFATLADICAPRAAVIVDMAYQLGLQRLLKFKFFLAAVRLEDWPMAASELRDSKLAKQAPNRVAENAIILETGQWPT